MGYESTLNYEFYDAEIENLDELNEKISKLDGMGDVKITKSSYGDSDLRYYYSIEMDSYTGKFYDDEEFADIISKHIVKGHLDLIYTGEDGAIWGLRVYPNKVKNLEARFMEIE